MRIVFVAIAVLFLSSCNKDMEHMEPGPFDTSTLDSTVFFVDLYIENEQIVKMEKFDDSWTLLEKLETHYLNDTVLQVYYVNDSLYQTSTYVFEGQSYAQHSLDSAFHGHSGGDSTYYVTNYSQFESGFLEKRSSSPGRHGYNPWETHSHLYRYSWSGTQEEIIWKYHDNLQVTPKSISGPSWSQTNVPLTRLWPLIDTMRYDIMYLQNSIIRKQLTKLPSASGRHFTDPTPDLVYIRFNYRLDNVKRVIKRTNILLEGDNSLGNDNYIEKEVFHYSYFY